MTTRTKQKLAPQVQFLAYHYPSLLVGDHTIRIDQSVMLKDQYMSTQTVKFHIAAVENKVNPTGIYSVFPPEGSRGEHGNVLPHIILNRSTQPWEKDARTIADDTKIPWLALLVFHENEAANFKTGDASGEILNGGASPMLGKQVALSGLVEKSSAADEVKWPGRPLQKGEKGTDLVQVIDVKKSFLKELLPSLADLPWLAHVRQGLEDEKTLAGTEKAVIVANRLPYLNGQSTAHLVSLTGRYKKKGFSFQSALDGQFIRLQSLKSWQFYNINHDRFKLTNSVTQALKADPDLNAITFPISFMANGTEYENEDDFLTAMLTMLNLKNWKKPAVNALLKTKLLEQCQHARTFSGLLEGLNQGTLALNKSVAEKKIAELLAGGFIPLPQHFRAGQQSISWYHGPCSASNQGVSTIELPVQSADQLLRYDEANGMFDVSYAAAWELGRLIMLNSKSISVKLFQWKRRNFQQIQSGQQALSAAHLVSNKDKAVTELPLFFPDSVAEWFAKLRLLYGIPFNYLVPDEKLLPPESIRFFQIDPDWIHCLLDGAFSIGRVAAHDFDLDTVLKKHSTTQPLDEVSGFLLRSEVVAGWPALICEGYDILPDKTDLAMELGSTNKLKLLRQDKLSKNVMLCLFAGKIKTIDIHQKPENLHFGLDWTKSGDQFKKILRGRSGVLKPSVLINKNTLEPLLNNLQRLNINGLAEAIVNAKKYPSLGFNSFTSAEFALTMLESVQRVRFIT